MTDPRYAAMKAAQQSPHTFAPYAITDQDKPGHVCNPIHTNRPPRRRRERPAVYDAEGTVIPEGELRAMDGNR
jgi:hypothetical protein